MDNPPMALSPEPALPGRHPRSLAYRAGVNQVVCTLVALVVWQLPVGDRNGFLVVWLYALLIGNLIWLFIDGGRILAARLLLPPGSARSQWPGWPAMAATIVLGSFAGYTLGSWLGDQLLGHHTPGLFVDQGVAIVTGMTAVAATYFFYSRERLYTEMAAAEAARRLAVEHQLKLLESQLEPHMLFNTLANLRVLIGLDPPRAQAMLDHLIAFLRGTLGASRTSTHPLATEFDRLADYLALMAIRMGPRLAVHFDLPEALRSVPVPPLLLQPLVENAIQHGLEPKVEGGRIEIQARHEAGRLLLSVRDTGLGLKPQAKPGSGYGTTHVRERLLALYGEQARLDLGPAPDGKGGTLALLSLPLPAAAPGTPAP